MMAQTARYALSVLNGEGKEKTWDIYQLFKKDRLKETTTMPQSTDYRKAVERIVRDGDLYKIDYVSTSAGYSFRLSTDRLVGAKQAKDQHLPRQEG